MHFIVAQLSFNLTVYVQKLLVQCSLLDDINHLHVSSVVKFVVTQTPQMSRILGR